MTGNVKSRFMECVRSHIPESIAISFELTCRSCGPRDPQTIDQQFKPSLLEGCTIVAFIRLVDLLNHRQQDVIPVFLKYFVNLRVDRNSESLHNEQPPRNSALELFLWADPDLATYEATASPMR